jgi:hypothetical protein
MRMNEEKKQKEENSSNSRLPSNFGVVESEAVLAGVGRFCWLDFFVDLDCDFPFFGGAEDASGVVAGFAAAESGVDGVGNVDGVAGGTMDWRERRSGTRRLELRDDSRWWSSTWLNCLRRKAVHDRWKGFVAGPFEMI